MSDNASMVHQAQLATSASGNVSQPFEYVSNTVGKRGTLLRRQGIHGNRARIAEDAKDGTYTVSGDLTLEPSPEDLAIWFPRVLGANANGTAYELAETLPTFVMAEDRVAKVLTWSGCKVDRAVLRGQKGGLLTLVLTIEALTESAGAAGTFPSLTITYTRAYAIFELTLAIGGANREIESFELTLNNNLVKDDFRNSQTRVELPVGPREITLQAAVPFTANNGAALYDVGATGANGSLVIASGNYSTTITFGKLQAPAEPQTAQNGEFMQSLTWDVCKTGNTAELSIVHDSTP
jgi:hypothetical protein